jgi:hypothetical protein
VAIDHSNFLCNLGEDVVEGVIAFRQKVEGLAQLDVDHVIDFVEEFVGGVFAGAFTGYAQLRMFELEQIG